MTTTDTAPPPAELIAVSGTEHLAVDLLLERAQTAVAFERERADKAEAEAARLRNLLEERERAAAERYLTPGEVAVLFRVDPKTVTKWAKSGRLTAVRTRGGHRRYKESEVRVLLAEEIAGS